MKKLSYVIGCLSMAALMMFNSCKKPETIVTPSVGTVTNTFIASIGDGSKTYIDYDGNYGLVKWSKRDMIYVNGIENGTLQIKETEGGVGTTSGVFQNTSEFIESPYFAAYHMPDKYEFRLQMPPQVEIEGTQIPFVPFYGNDKFYFGIPQDQTSLNTVHLDDQQEEYDLLEGCVPMAAYSTTNSLEFHNMVNIIRLDLKKYTESRETTTTVNRVTISSDENLWGVFSVTAPTDSKANPVPVPSVAVLPTSQGQGGGYGGPVQVPTPEIYSDLNNVTLTTDQSHEYVYFIVPVTSSASNMIHIRIDGNVVTETRDGFVETSGVFVKNVNLQQTCDPNTIYGIKLDVELEPAPYVFSVATNKRVGFSKSNLCYTHTYGYVLETGENQEYCDQTYYTTSFNNFDKVDHLVWTSHAAKAYYGYGYDYYHDHSPYNPNPDYTFGDNEILFTNSTATTPNPSFSIPSTTFMGLETGVWRSLSTDELKYMLGTDPSYNPESPEHHLYGRDEAWKKCGKVKIRVEPQYGGQTRDVCGFLILPDNYDGNFAFDKESLNLDGPFGTGYKNFTGGIEIYQGSGDYQNVWAYLKEHGAVFLPSSGSTLAGENSSDPSVTYTYDVDGTYGALYLSDGFRTEFFQSQEYPYYNYKHYCKCFYWNATIPTSSANWYLESETKYGRLIRLVKDY